MGIKNEIKQNQQLANEHHKPIVRKFKKKNSSLIYWYTDMQLISKYNKGIKFLLCAIDLF